MPEITFIDLAEAEWVPIKVEPILEKTIKLGMILEEDENEKRVCLDRLKSFGLIEDKEETDDHSIQT